MKEKKKILIAEDNEFLGKTIEEYLKDNGYIVDISENGEDALKKMRKNKYNVVLLDLIMPKMNGFEVLVSLQKSKEKMPPIVVFSNLSQEEDEKNILELGAKACLVKHNIALEELVGIVEKYSE